MIQSPIRLSIMAALRGVEKAEFSLVRDVVELSDATLSKQMSQLEEAGYLKVHKGFVGRRPRTWLALTNSGRIALQSHLEVLREIANSNLGQFLGQDHRTLADRPRRVRPKIADAAAGPL